MKITTAIPILSVMLANTLADHPSDAFYVWQQTWSSNVVYAVSSEPATTLYPLVTVIPDQGKSALVDIPWRELAQLKHRIVPVIRIPLHAFKRPDITQELSSITAQIRNTAKTCTIDEIQFDLDCPERLLPDYLQLVQTYRQAWPDLRLSITALPVHLGNDAFRALAAETDYYVLQVHGLNVPKQLSDPARLLIMHTAERAIRKAEALGHPYRIALPCYAYELNFDPGSEEFLYLTAERPVRRQETIKKRIVANPEDLLNLLAQMETLEYAGGIIWFRLPVNGDRLCLPRADLEKLQKGSIPPYEIECRVNPISDTTIELELFNGNTIHSTAITISMTWPEPAGAYDLYRHIHAESSVPGHLPNRLTVPIPPPGQSKKMGWFETAKPPTTKTTFQ